MINERMTAGLACLLCKRLDSKCETTRSKDYFAQLQKGACRRRKHAGGNGAFWNGMIFFASRDSVGSLTSDTRYFLESRDRGNG
jgi:hypothetical protein